MAEMAFDQMCERVEDVLESQLPAMRRAFPEIAQLHWDPHGNTVWAYDARGERLPITTRQLEDAGLRY